ncbi:quinon protein alcohol dehydrogenase-like superfamily [Helicostylum pulchrum]|nr:quinon protein alcohol dehydrogenase-like superfamily [Helicostylum pulchrum]
MATEVALSASNTDNTIYVWDIRSGSSLFSFKQSMSPKGGLAMVPKPGASFQIGSIVTAQTDRANLNVYQWQRDQVLHKMNTAEKMVSVASSNQGQYLAAATAGGKVYLWHIPTGHLMRVFEAHYRRITSLAFSNDDSVLLTGSEDAAVNVWLLAHLINPVSAEGYEDITARPAPLYSWSDHTLPVSDIYIGHGSLSGARVCTASSDHTVKLWDLATGQLLTTFLFPKAVSSVIMDPSETTIFAACEDKIYSVDLYKSRQDQTYKITTTESLGGMSRVESVGIKSATPSSLESKTPSLGSIFTGHTGAINSLTLSFDGTILISGAEDGNCIVWDVLSRQPLRKFESHKGPVSFVSCFLRPIELHPDAATQIITPMPWKQLKRAMPTSEEEHRDASMQVIQNTEMDLSCHQHLVESGPVYSNIDSELQSVQKAADVIRDMKTDDSSASLQNQVNALQAELIRLNEHHAKSKSLHNEMYTIVVDKFMEERRNKRKLEDDDEEEEEEEEEEENQE